jgi:hypothetical protein
MALTVKRLLACNALDSAENKKPMPTKVAKSHIKEIALYL